MICERIERFQRDREERIDPLQIYLDEIEVKIVCKGSGCNGRMRMSMVRLQEMSGFVGGLA